MYSNVLHQVRPPVEGGAAVVADVRALARVPALVDLEGPKEGI